MKTNELGTITDFTSTNSFIVNGTSGTGILTGTNAVEFMKDYFLAGGVPYGKELTDSWTNLTTKIKAGNFAGIHVGDYKTITLTTGETVVMEVAGIDTYYRNGNTQLGHHIDFISRDCLAGTKQFNTTNNNNGNATNPNPWKASLLYTTLNGDGTISSSTGVISTLPSDLKSVIVQKRSLMEKRYSESDAALTANTGWDWYDIGYLWIPREIEVFGYTSWSEPGYGIGDGVQYPIFYGGYKHIIKGAGNGGNRCNWWEASAYRLNAAYVCHVGNGGGANHYYASDTGIYAPLCFRIA